MNRRNLIKSGLLALFAVVLPKTRRPEFYGYAMKKTGSHVYGKRATVDFSIRSIRSASEAGTDEQIIYAPH